MLWQPLSEKSLRAASLICFCLTSLSGFSRLASALHPTLSTDHPVDILSSPLRRVNQSGGSGPAALSAYPPTRPFSDYFGLMREE